MSKWVVKKGDSCPKCGAKVEVLVGKDDEDDEDTVLESPKVERCTSCDWEYNLDDDSDAGKNLI